MVDLGGDTTICHDETLTLDAGSGFTSYLWNDLSTNQTLTVSGPGLVSVEVTDANGCTGMASAQVDTVTCVGIREHELAGRILVFPNPNSGSFAVELSNFAAGNAQVDVLNSLGQVVAVSRMAIAGDVYTERFALDLPAGVYHLRMVHNNNVYTQRVVVE